MKKLIAVAPILYGCTQYEVGDALPEDSAWTETWLENHTAAWIEDSDLNKTAAKAIPMTAEPGQIGLSTTGMPDDLAGKIPKTPAREKPKPRKRKTT